MGVAIAGIVIAGLKLGLFGAPAELPGLLLFIYIGMLLAYFLLREQIRSMNRKTFFAHWWSVLEDFGNYVACKLGFRKGP